MTGGLNTPPTRGPSSKWIEILPEYGTMIVLGRKRHGKTGLAYHIGEERHDCLGKRMAVWGPGASVRPLLPDWIEIATSLEHLMTFKDRTLVIDEGSLASHARDWRSASAMELDQAISLSGQRRQLLIDCTHHSRKLDPLLLREADVLAFKIPTKMHTKMERGEIRTWSLEARDRLLALAEGVRKAWTWALWDDFEEEGLVENPLPTFWRQEISEATSAALDEDGDLPEQTIPMQVSPEERQLLQIVRSGHVGVSSAISRRLH